MMWAQLFLQTFMISNFIMKLSTLVKHLMGYTIQVTGYKYSVPVLRNDLLSDGV